MTPAITQEQRHAIDAHRGHPVYVVDSHRRETFVLLRSSDYDKVRLILEPPEDDEPWTESKNARRIDLIDKRIAETITDEEQIELAGLQRQAEHHFDQIAPPPTEGLQALHKQLIEMDRGER